MTRYASVDLSRLPAPAAIEALSYEAMLDARMSDLVARFATVGIGYDVAGLETDPAKILQEVDTYRELLVRARINDAVLATSLAYASGSDLDVRAADFSTVRVDGESDDSLRRRAQLAWEALSIGGSYGGYEYRALSAAPVELADVAVYGAEVAGVPEGEVRVVCLASSSSGIPTGAVLERVRSALDVRRDRKVNDRINVVAATPAPYSVDATLVLRTGADGSAVRDAQYRRVLAYSVSRRQISAPVTFGGLMAALGHDDAGYVVDVEMRAPYGGSVQLSSLAAIGGGPFTAPLCSGIALDWRTQ